MKFSSTISTNFREIKYVIEKIQYYFIFSHLQNIRSHFYNLISIKYSEIVCDTLKYFAENIFYTYKKILLP